MKCAILTPVSGLEGLVGLRVKGLQSLTLLGTCNPSSGPPRDPVKQPRIATKQALLNSRMHPQ